MDDSFINQWMWWISIVEIPALAGLFVLIMNQMRDLAAFREEVARTYASGVQVRELELRLTAHLLRIEAKLDATALKAEHLSAKQGEKP
jgi:hypothetical protein